MSRTFRRNKRTNRKTERDNYYRKGAHDTWSCGNHHGFGWCKGNRLYGYAKRILEAEFQIKELGR